MATTVRVARSRRRPSCPAAAMAIQDLRASDLRHRGDGLASPPPAATPVVLGYVPGEHGYVRLTPTERGPAPVTSARRAAGGTPCSLTAPERVTSIGVSRIGHPRGAGPWQETRLSRRSSSQLQRPLPVLARIGRAGQGWCGGAFVFDIESGRADGVDLSGKKAAFSTQWPGDFWSGKGTAWRRKAACSRC
jgi:hypothetical protein